MLSPEENEELEILRGLQNSTNRWFTQSEYDRYMYLFKKAFDGAGRPYTTFQTNNN